MEIFHDNGEVEIDVILNFGKKINYSFPKTYISLVQKYDSLQLEDNCFNFTNIYDKDDERDLNFLSFKEDKVENIFDEQSVSDPEYAGIPHL